MQELRSNINRTNVVQCSHILSVVYFNELPLLLFELVSVSVCGDSLW